MANIFALPKYVKATSPEGLRRFMYMVQAKDKMQYNFFDISFVDGYWYAWYFFEPKTQVQEMSEAKELVTNNKDV